jgi:hypothetical protein
MYYVVRHGKKLTDELGSETYVAAKRFAEQCHKETGHHYHVVELKTVWTTKTLAEAMAEG